MQKFEKYKPWEITKVENGYVVRNPDILFNTFVFSSIMDVYGFLINLETNGQKTEINEVDFDNLAPP